MRSTVAILLALLLLGLSACDSNDEPTDAQRFIGSWNASSVTTPGLDLLDLLGTVTANFPTSRSFSMRAVDPSGVTILDVSGTFEAIEGEITFKGEFISGLKPHQIAEKGMIRTFQFTSLFPDLTVEDNVICAKHLGKNGGFLGSIFWSQGYRRGEAKLRQEVMEILSFVMLQKRSKMVARNLPAAEQRILEIGIALAAKPKLLLLDEPMAGMGPGGTVKMTEVIQSLKGSVTILLVEHDMNAVFSLADRITVLVYGQPIATGTPDEISANDEVRRAYLGEEETEESTHA